MKNHHITIVGNVVAAPEKRSTGSGEPIASFRVACNPTYFKDGQWHEGEVSYYSVSAFRRLAENVLLSIEQGQRVIVSGTLRIRQWESGDKSGISADIDAEAVGPDLLFGTTVFRRGSTGSTVSNGSAPPADGESAAWSVPGADGLDAPAAALSESTAGDGERSGELLGVGAGDSTPF